MTLRPALFALLLPTTLLASCGDYRGLESAHQPVVSRSDYSLDLATTGYGLAQGEDIRLAGWLATMRIGYGDSVSLDDPTGSSVTRNVVATQVASRGLLLSENAPITTGVVQPGTARVIISRATARVPSCPDRSLEDGSPNFSGRTSTNYGCGMNSTIAAMIANPADLVRGQPGATSVDPLASTKPIDAFRKAQLSGAGGQTIKSESTGGR